jgi:hypothetical protein
MYSDALIQIGESKWRIFTLGSIVETSRHPSMDPQTKAYSIHFVHSVKLLFIARTAVFKSKKRVHFDCCIVDSVWTYKTLTIYSLKKTKKNAFIFRVRFYHKLSKFFTSLQETVDLGRMDSGRISILS